MLNVVQIKNMMGYLEFFYVVFTEVNDIYLSHHMSVVAPVRDIIHLLIIFIIYLSLLGYIMRWALGFVFSFLFIRNSPSYM